MGQKILDDDDADDDDDGDDDGDHDDDDEDADVDVDVDVDGDELAAIRCNTKWRPNHRAPKLLVVLLRVAYFFCGRKRLLRFHLSAAHSGRNVFGVVPFVSQSVCPLCLRAFLLGLDLLDL